MILPAKHLRAERSILVIGAEILSVLNVPSGVSETWERVQRARRAAGELEVGFDEFVMALSFLFAVSGIEFQEPAQIMRAGA